jgi:hypothetical protein
MSSVVTVLFIYFFVFKCNDMCRSLPYFRNARVCNLGKNLKRTENSDLCEHGPNLWTEVTYHIFQLATAAPGASSLAYSIIRCECECVAA